MIKQHQENQGDDQTEKYGQIKCQQNIFFLERNLYPGKYIKIYLYYF